MLEVVIKHNPYKVISEITVNGENPKSNSQIKQYLNQRFQMWVDQIPELLSEEYNDDEMNVIFYGTELDYQDLLSALKAEKEKSGIQFKAKKMPAKEFGDKEKDIRNLFKKIQELPFDEIRSPAVINAFELAFNELLEVNVVATMSAGKSTLINALLRKKLMPSKMAACTATITRIQDNDDPKFQATAYDDNESEIIHYPELDYQKMVGLNKDKEVKEIKVFGNIPFVKSDEVALVLVDTPGPDNALDKSHGIVTEKALEQSSKMLVIFVVNGTKPNDVAQDELLKKIAKSMSARGKQSRDRFLFVINKVDTYDVEEDDIENETIPQTVKYLESKGIENPNIFLAAAQPALLIRRYLDSNDDSERSELLKDIQPIAEKLIRHKQLHLERYAKLPLSCQETIDGELEIALSEGDILGQALVHTGIRGIEETIRMYVTKYCRPAKITNVVNTFINKLDDAEAFEKTRKEIASRQTEKDKLAHIIDTLTEKLTSKVENNAFKEKIENLNIESELAGCIDTLLKDVQDAFRSFWAECPKEMEEYIARGYIQKFANLATKKQSEFQVAVDRLLLEDIQLKGQKLLDEYIKRLAAISEEGRLEGLQIDLSSFVRGKLTGLNESAALINSVDSRLETHTEERFRTVTKRRRGWDRVFHPENWFDPEYKVTEPYEVDVDVEIRFISREKLKIQSIGQIRKNLMNERSRILEFAKEETENIKRYFYAQFAEVDALLAQKTNELRYAIQSKKNSEEALAEAKSLLSKLDAIKMELENILDI